MCLGARELWLQPDGKAHVRFLDVGQGDSALLTLADGNTIVIDGGPDWSTLERLGTYMPFFKRRIDILILSHPNSDHMVSFPEILRRYSVGTLVIAGTQYDSGIYHATLSGASLHGIPIVTMHAGQHINLGEDSIDVLWPPEIMPKGFDKDANNESLTVRFTHNGKRVLFTGDLESIVERTLVAAHADLKADVLKVPHHGSKTSSSDDLLRAVQPSIAVISVGRENTYGHPNPEVVARLKAIGADTNLNLSAPFRAGLLNLFLG
jgi:competence protein ComEC